MRCGARAVHLGKLAWRHGLARASSHSFLPTMSAHPDEPTQQRRRRQGYQDEINSPDLVNGKRSRPEALATSLESISVQPRTPKTPRARAWGEDEQMDEVELSLLDKGGQADDDETGEKGVKRPMSTRDRRAIILLIILCEWATYA